ncbi:MAG: hypothetical protein ACI9HA_003351, partial [Dinoroseobacter sp.]
DPVWLHQLLVLIQYLAHPAFLLKRASHTPGYLWVTV